MLVYKITQYVNIYRVPILYYSDLSSRLSFSNATDLAIIPYVSLHDMEVSWNRDGHLLIVFHYSTDIYYLVVPDELPSSPDYRRMKLEEGYDVHDHHCDYYARPFLIQFIARWNRRLHTRTFLYRMIGSLSTSDPREIQYHEEFLSSLQREQLDDSFDHTLLKEMINESRTIIETEKRYRPDGEGFNEAKQEFEKIASLSVPSSLE